MSEINESGVVDAALYFEQRHGRRAFAERNASQLLLGDGAYNPFQNETCGSRKATLEAPNTAVRHSDRSGRCAQEDADGRPVRRPRGPGKDFARYIEANGFPADAARRSARVDVARERLYQYEHDGLHTHKKLMRMPFRSKQCDGNLQLFLRPEEAQARADAQRQRQLQGQVASSPGRCSPLPTEVHHSRCLASTPLNHDDSSFTLTHVDNGDGKQRSVERTAQLRHRLQLLEELYAREYARLEELTLRPHEGEAVEDEDAKSDSGRLQQPCPPDASLEQAMDHVQAQTSPRRRRARCASEMQVQGEAATHEDSTTWCAHRSQRPVQPWERACSDAGAAEEDASSPARQPPPGDETEFTGLETPQGELDDVSSFFSGSTQVDGSRRERRVRPIITPSPAGQAHGSTSPQAWFIPSPQQPSGVFVLRPTLRSDTSSLQKTSPPPRRRQQQRWEEAAQREQRFLTPPVVEPPVSTVRPPSASLFASRTTKSLRDVVADRQATSFLMDDKRVSVPPLPVQQPTAAPTTAPRTLREVCRALHAPL
ncbi:hypothetical protein ABB37_05624 [Leptomonas pyrrhocoris]|uniref:Uncharacterized protein n=1 Tax=Leptomonas pyrrhocoris TaxID=157538 RepID=A0A0M9FZ71_LEPPY|nr:hypothetical protein ABB37_05624 [Leptomonas pyrrhocoris]KPA79105.1 hypothetical protein ABB37_05624 [Leptomonas pyrrhocoris]|eukprot:XP_015657544.1 hypothetical protein ABB37_05624 [Leptomonas pyrrhocoris]